MNADDPRTMMWERALAMLEQAERLHKQFFQLGRSASHRPVWEPPVDIYEFRGGLHIVVALPGVATQGLTVMLDNGVVVVAGTRPVPVEARSGTIHRLEIPYGHFERRIEGLPRELELIRSDLRDGCLFLTFRKN